MFAVLKACSKTCMNWIYAVITITSHMTRFEAMVRILFFFHLKHKKNCL